ncbi:MAG: hypothetical protein ACTSVA_00900 [Candidatus Njordarchaeales archaeon]
MSYLCDENYTEDKFNTLKSLVKSYDFLNKMRFALESRKLAYKNNRWITEILGIISETREIDNLKSVLEGQVKLIDIYKNAINMVDKEIKRQVKLHPLYEVLSDIKGIGHLAIANILVNLPSRFPDKPSQLVSFWLGYENGRPAKRKAGKGTTWNANMRTKLLGPSISRGLLTHNKYYKEIYDKRRKHTLITHPEWGLTKDGKPYKLHYHRDAVRNMMEEFIEDVWRIIHNYLKFLRGEKNEGMVENEKEI